LIVDPELSLAEIGNLGRPETDINVFAYKRKQGWSIREHPAEGGSERRLAYLHAVDIV